MAKNEDAFDGFDPLLAEAGLSDPWLGDAGARTFIPDFELLGRLLGVPISERRVQSSGRVARAVDAWCAHELRRAGFEADEVWPRASRPRVMSRETALLIEGLPARMRDDLMDQVLRNKKVAPAEANVLGRVFVKQADVLIAQWARGPELLVSTKTMLSSYGKNLRNRFEESYGDAKNLRGRYPLLSLGFLYLLRSTVLDDGANWEFAIDMLRKLREDVDVYDTTGLLLVEWSDDEFAGVRILDDQVPEDLRVDQFLDALIARVLERTPVEFHVRVRELREGRSIALREGDHPGGTE